MSEDNTGSAGRKPDFIAYNVRESGDGKGYWNKVGAAWRHRDGRGYEVHLESLPVDGRVSLRELRDERMQGYEDERRAPARDEPAGPAPEPGPGRGRTR